MNDTEHRPSSDASPSALRLGVLGAADGWYMRDLKRAAQHFSGDRAVRIEPLAFSELHVAYWEGPQPIASAGAGSPAGNGAPAPDLRSALDALMVRTMPLGSLEQTIFRMNALHVAERSGTRVVNPPRALEIAIDKWLTLDTLRRAGLEIPRTVCCQTRAQAMEGWRALGSDCVVKPIFGGEGRGILRVTDPDMAWRVFSTLEQLQSVMYLQEFLESPGYDLRLLVIADAVFCVRRENRSDWRTNVSRGGTAIQETPSFEQVSMAFAACKTIGAWMAGVDILPTRDGRNVVLEVNAVPGWKATANALGVDIAHVILEQLVADIAAR
jgi:tetrahydromethanopterin:alpha-L-glutamate ligase